MSPSIVNVEASTPLGRNSGAIHSPAMDDDVVSSDSDLEVPSTIKSISTTGSSSQTSAPSSRDGTPEDAGSKCMRCNALVPSDALQLHEAYHLRYTGKTTCEFEACCYQTKTSGNMRAHRRVHYGDYPYVCMARACYKRFKTAELLWAHRDAAYHELRAKKDVEVREAVTLKHYKKVDATRRVGRAPRKSSRKCNKSASGMRFKRSHSPSPSLSPSHPHQDLVAEQPASTPPQPQYASFYAIITTLDTITISPPSPSPSESPPRLRLPDKWSHEVVHVDPIVVGTEDPDNLEYVLMPVPTNSDAGGAEGSSQSTSMLSRWDVVDFLAFTSTYTTTFPPKDLCMVFRFRRVDGGLGKGGGVGRFVAAPADLEEILEAGQVEGRELGNGRGKARGRGRGRGGGSRGGRGRAKGAENGMSGGPVGLDKTFFEFVRSTVPQSPYGYEIRDHNEAGGLGTWTQGENHGTAGRTGGGGMGSAFTLAGDLHSSYIAPAQDYIPNYVAGVGSGAQFLTTQFIPQGTQARPGPSSFLPIPPISTQNLLPTRIAEPYQTTGITNGPPPAGGYWNFSGSAGITGHSGFSDARQVGSAIPQAPQIPQIGSHFPESVTGSRTDEITGGPSQPQAGVNRRKKTDNLTHLQSSDTHFQAPSQNFPPAMNTTFNPPAFSTTAEDPTNAVVDDNFASNAGFTSGACQYQPPGAQHGNSTWEEAQGPWSAPNWDFIHFGIVGAGAGLGLGVGNGLDGTSHWEVCVPGGPDPNTSLLSTTAPGTYDYGNYCA